jgi:hypothetical protein
VSTELLIKLLSLLINSKDVVTISAVLSVIEIVRVLLTKAKNGEPVTQAEMDDAKYMMNSAVEEWDEAVAKAQPKTEEKL